ncbi:hypothetical protein P43SY_004006 [Pythium insidiosum]|uniref:Cyclin N-terminal domain-containing protein n=1 Tax=Pythium insidiosum TaxID=114742 RepID=A0AAD5Q3C0_PYTIN|nr:hypothetical protein P43SY_004006 [Pythium insidiosum]
MTTPLRARQPDKTAGTISKGAVGSRRPFRDITNASRSSTSATEITPKMRAILVDWLIEVHHSFRLKEETLFLAVNYLDRFLNAEPVARKELQLVGIGALFIAAKLEEIDPIEAADLVFVCDEAFRADEIVSMERRILQALRFDLIVPTTHAILDIFLQEAGVTRSVQLVAQLLAQHSLYHLNFSAAYTPSVLAAASLFAATCAVDGARPSSHWMQSFERLTSHSMMDVIDCSRDLCVVMASPSRRLAGLRRKFASKRFDRIVHPEQNAELLATLQTRLADLIQ